MIKFLMHLVVVNSGRRSRVSKSSAGKSCPRLLLIAALILSSMWCAAPTHATIVFNGYANGLPGIGSSGVGADWSSDFGVDYRAYPSGAGNIGGTTTPATWPDGSFHSNESITLDVQRAMFVDTGSAEYLRATGVIDVGESGAASPATVHRYRIDSIDYNPHNGIGLGAGGVLHGVFDFSGVSSSSPLHWAANWQINIVNPGTINSSIDTSQIVIQRDGIDLFRIPGGSLPASQNISGSVTGSTLNSRIEIYAESSLSGGRMLGESRVTLELQIKFAEQPFALPGDYNQNGVVDAADFVVWRRSVGQTGAGLAADGNGDGTINADDYQVWRSHFGQPPGSGAAGYPLGASAESLSAAAPEPTSNLVCLVALSLIVAYRNSVRSR
jgi:Dockerin type I domain